MDRRYLGSPDFAHATRGRTGVLLVNLGTPSAPTRTAVRRYLAVFLSDPRVIELPRWLWLPVLHGVILRLRPRRTAAAYRAVWTQEGSPLLVNSRRQRDALAAALGGEDDGAPRVELGMRYGNPSIPEALDRLHTSGVRRLLVLPLYPQYSATTTATAFDAIADVLRRWRWVPELRLITSYHDDAGYVGALAQSLGEAEAAGGGTDRVLFSFHGLPERYFRAGDPYFCHCQKTARLVAERAGLGQGSWAVSFQSRVGREPWLRPYTDEILEEWAREGVRTVRVLCPGFAADCLETLEEVAIGYRETFERSAGDDARLEYVAALNDRPEHIRALTEIVRAHASDWLERDADPDANAEARVARARALGAPR